MLKKIMKTSLSIVLALSITLVPSSSTSAQIIPILSQFQPVIPASTLKTNAIASTTSDDTIKQLAEKKANAITAVYGATSVQYALIDNGEIILSGQAGKYSRESKTSLTDSTMYGIGSISKMFTTTAIMQLVEQGKINLDSPVKNYVKDFFMADSRYQDITVRMLLNHSSGLMGSTLENALSFDNQDFSNYDNFLSILKNQRLKANPGEFSVYCNDGFSLAELLVERVTGISFSNYILKYISYPLSLNETKTPRDSFDSEKLAKTYLMGIEETLPIDSVHMIGAGGMYSCAVDLCKFAQIFMNKSRSSILTKNSTLEMEKPEYLNGLWPKTTENTMSFGLGWDSVSTYPFGQYGIKALEKSGDTQLYHGSFIVLPEENMAIAILSSGGVSAYNQIMSQEILLAQLKEKGTISEIKPNITYKKPVKVDMPADYLKYQGIYANIYGVMKIDINKDGTLFLTNEINRNVPTQKFIYTGDGKFYYIDGSSYYSFAEEKNGKTYLFCEGYGLLPGLGQTVTSSYQGQKLPNNPLPKSVLKSWKQREGKTYFVLTEKYSSQTYATGLPTASISLLKDIEGYCANATILDKDRAKTLLEIPGVYGRDLRDYNFYKKGSVEYLYTNGSMFLSENAIKPLSTKSTFTTTIGNNGYANWFKISKKSANRTIKITLPKNSSFAVYDENGTYVTYSYVSHKNTVNLPENGYIVFIGSKDATFKIQYKG